MNEHRRFGEGAIVAELVADLLDEVYAANGLLADDSDRVLGSGAAVSQSTIDRFTSLADRLPPGAMARMRLSSLEPWVMVAGTRIWVTRNRERQASSECRVAFSRRSGEVPA